MFWEKKFSGPYYLSTSPHPGTPCFESPNTKVYFIFEEIYFTNRILHECKYFLDCFYSSFETSSKNDCWNSRS